MSSPNKGSSTDGNFDSQLEHFLWILLSSLSCLSLASLLPCLSTVCLKNCGFYIHYQKAPTNSAFRRRQNSPVHVDSRGRLQGARLQSAEDQPHLRRSGQSPPVGEISCHRRLAHPQVKTFSSSVFFQQYLLCLSQNSYAIKYHFDS